MESDLSDLVKSLGLDGSGESLKEEPKRKSLKEDPKRKGVMAAEDVQRNIRRLERQMTSLIEKFDEKEKAEKEDPEQYTFTP